MVRILVLAALVAGCNTENRQTAGGPDMGGGVESKAPKITLCGELPPVAAGSCEVTAGGPVKLLRGTVLLPGEVLRGGSVAIGADGKITCAACDCAAQAAGATIINCAKGVISPGLINTHDHITYAQNAPAPDTGERYEHRHDWRKGIRGHTKIPAPGNASVQQIQWGELRFVLGGGTSTVGSGSAKGLLRNLDKADQEGLGQMAVDFETFPLGDSDGSMFASGCNYSFKDTAMSIAADDAYEPHISEGIDAEARNEFVCSSMMGAHDLTQPNAAFIHAIGLKPGDYAKMSLAGTSVIWSPRSNVSLYGDTAQVATAARAGVNIALGTDWILSGSMNMLRELACADGLNKSYYDNYFSDEELWLMATRNAALATATDDAIGTLAVGKVADIAVFDGSVNADHRAILAAEPKDVLLVLRGGKLLYGDAAIAAALGGNCDAVDVCGVAKSVCLMDDVGMSYAALKTAGGMYPAFFCGVPMGEPSCAPRRPKAVNGSTIYDGVVKAGDKDGDGIPDAMDNCPSFFNPVRPVDEGAQGDADTDGVGDACHPCPLEANVTRCAPLTVPPEEPAVMPTAATIYDIKSGTIAVGKTVTLSRQIVTGVAKVGFFVQIKDGDPGFDAARGARQGGIWVHQAMPTVMQGQRVSVTGKVTDYFGQIQLDQVTVTVDAATPEALPAPVVVQAADVATGGALAKDYEGALVEIDNVAVTDLAPPLGAGDREPSGEFAVEGGLRVDNFLYEFALPAAGARFSKLVGLMTLKNENYKLEPRSAADLVP